MINSFLVLWYGIGLLWVKHHGMGDKIRVKIRGTFVWIMERKNQGDEDWQCAPRDRFPPGTSCHRARGQTLQLLIYRAPSTILKSDPPQNPLPYVRCWYSLRLLWHNPDSPPPCCWWWLMHSPCFPLQMQLLHPPPMKTVESSAAMLFCKTNQPTSRLVTGQWYVIPIFTQPCSQLKKMHPNICIDIFSFCDLPFFTAE